MPHEIAGENIHFSIMTVVNIVIFAAVIIANFFYLKNETSKIKLKVDGLRDEKDADKEILTNEIKKLEKAIYGQLKSELEKIYDKLELKISRIDELAKNINTRIDNELIVVEKKLDEQKVTDKELHTYYENIKELASNNKTTIKNLENKIESNTEHINTILNDRLNLIEEKYSIHIDNINKTMNITLSNIKEMITVLEKRLNRLEDSIG